MPKYRCDFNVVGDLVLPKDADDPCTIALPSGASVEFSNGDCDEGGHTTSLVAKVIGEARAIGEAEVVLRKVLAAQLDLLCFVTQSRFQIEDARRVIEWEPGKRQRQLLVHRAVDARYPPSPDLRQTFFNSCETLEGMDFPSFVRTALKYFRYGCLDRSPEDQFMRFWIALEIVAENTKLKERVPITCAKCSKHAKCAHCGFEASRVPMATSAIRSLIEKITAPRIDVSNRQLTTRNGLMHGRDVAAIEAEVGISLSAIVDELARVTWNAISETILTRPDNGDAPLDLGHNDGKFGNGRLVVVGNFLFDAGAGEHPSEEQLPKIEASIAHRFVGE